MCKVKRLCILALSSVWVLPHCHLPCRGRRWQCCSEQLWSKPVAASPSLPASYSSCGGRQASHSCCQLRECLHQTVCLSMWQKVGTLLLHLPTSLKNIPVLIRLRERVSSVTQTYLVGDTTSKQKRRSMSSQCLTVHSLRSSTTTVGLSWRNSTMALVKQSHKPRGCSATSWQPQKKCIP